MKTTITTIFLVVILQFSFSNAVNAVDVRQTCIEGLNENSDLIFSQSEYNTLLNACVKKYSSYETKSTSPSTKKKTKKSSITPEAVFILLLFPIASWLTGFIAAFISDSKNSSNKEPSLIYLVIYYVPISLLSFWLWVTYFASSPKSVILAILIGFIWFTRSWNDIDPFSQYLPKKNKLFKWAIAFILVLIILIILFAMFNPSEIDIYTLLQRSERI